MAARRAWSVTTVAAEASRVASVWSVSRPAGVNAYERLVRPLTISSFTTSTNSTSRSRSRTAYSVPVASRTVPSDSASTWPRITYP
jgi:hypothetical protein